MENKVVDNYERTGRHSQKWYVENSRILKIRTQKHENYLRRKKRTNNSETQGGVKNTN